jgi:hypothetical protein
VCTAPHEDRAAAHLCGALNSLQRYNRAARAGRDRCIPHCVRNTFAVPIHVTVPSVGILPEVLRIGRARHISARERGVKSGGRAGGTGTVPSGEGVRR